MKISLLEPKPPNADGAVAVVAPNVGELNENADVVAVFVAPNPNPVPNPPTAGAAAMRIYTQNKFRMFTVVSNGYSCKPNIDWSEFQKPNGNWFVSVAGVLPKALPNPNPVDGGAV